MIFLLISGCFFDRGGPFPPDDDVGCTAEARISVSVELLDPDGTPLEEADVVWRSETDGESCELWGDGTWACGFEVGGELTIVAEHETYGEVSETVFVDSDVCHVITEELSLQFEEPDCPDVDPSASVLASVFYEDGSPHGDAEAFWEFAEGDMQPMPCDLVGGDLEHVFACGTGVGGALLVWATSDAGSSEWVHVEVELDDCGLPIVEEIDLVIVEDRE